MLATARLTLQINFGVSRYIYQKHVIAVSFFHLFFFVVFFLIRVHLVNVGEELL